MNIPLKDDGTPDWLLFEEKIYAVNGVRTETIKILKALYSHALEEAAKVARKQDRTALPNRIGDRIRQERNNVAQAILALKDKTDG